jgi:hypothetical protein
VQQDRGEEAQRLDQISEKEERLEEMRKLGSVQTAVLESLIRRRKWSKYCGWVWDTNSNTAEIMDSLVRRGLVKTKLVGEKLWYMPTDEGKKAVTPI